MNDIEYNISYFHQLLMCADKPEVANQYFEQETQYKALEEKMKDIAQARKALIREHKLRKDKKPKDYDMHDCRNAIRHFRGLEPLPRPAPRPVQPAAPKSTSSTGVAHLNDLFDKLRKK